MSSPVEYRYFHRKFTLEHARAGISPLHDVSTNPPSMYAPNVLQYRYKVRVGQGAEIITKWSDWQDIPIVKEGREDAETSDAG